MNNFFDNTDNIKFAENHIGGNINDEIKNYNNQSNIVSNASNDFQRLIDYRNELSKEKNKNNKYIEKLDKKLNETIYRINNYETQVDDISISNPIIYPEEYDEYFEYLNNKNINSLNTQIIKKKNYINIDSSNRTLKSNLNVDQYINLENNSLEFFFPSSNVLRINLVNANTYFSSDDYIILRGLKNYTISYKNISFFFKNESSQVILDLKPNFINAIPYYNIFIKISGVTNGNSNVWKNIPLQLINQIHSIYIVNLNDDVRLAFDLPLIYYSNNYNDETLFSDCNITFYNIGNYPINLIDSNTPLTENNLSNYLIIKNVTNKYLEVILNNNFSLNKNILLEGIWNTNSFCTGTNIQIAKISSFVQGFISPSNYSINLDKNYNNICSIKIISSEIPNVQNNIISSNNLNYVINTIKISGNNTINSKFILNNNNKLYWQNAIDYDTYVITLDKGYYSYSDLKSAIEYKASLVKRNLIYTNYSIYEYNMLEVNFYNESYTSQFNLYNLFILPNCLYNITQNPSTNLNEFIIKIKHPLHNLNVGDKIFIIDSIDYFNIDKKYINNSDGHIVTNVINNDFYEITIKYINLIDDVGDTKGGFDIKIKTYAIFRLLFNFIDTMGSVIGFPLVGNSYSITPYCGSFNNYTITNKQNYYADIIQVLIANGNLLPNETSTNFNNNNFNYILLQIEGLNYNSNPNGPEYFYKFLLNGQVNGILYNTFVNSPIYFNPPMKSLNQLNFTFINPDGSLVDFGNLNHSFTIELTSLNNLPENTNLNVFMGRI